MNPTFDRDQVAQLAKTDTAKAVEVATQITDPWFEAQAWAYLVRYSKTPIEFSIKAAEAALRTKDEYQRSAVRAWEIAALAEREYYSQASAALAEAVELAATIEHPGHAARL